MTATSVNWCELNLNGKIITKTSKAYIRCEWRGAGCHMLIIAQDMEDIDLQVERDVTHMCYTSSRSKTELECIIFTISLNRPATWAKNGVSTWNGKIGIKFDSIHPPWSFKIYKEHLTSLLSCFYPNDISCQTPEQITQVWNVIGQEEELINPTSRINPFKHLQYEHLVRLSPEGWLNGDLVMAGLQDWCTDKVMGNHPDHPPILVMNEYFFKKLSSEGVDSVASWTKKETPTGTKHNINIFEYGYIVVVVNWNKSHWILVVIINPVNALVSTGDPAIIAVLDSIADCKSVAHINKHLCIWLQHQANNPFEDSLHLQIISAQVPQQRNAYDCGIYVIHFAKTFFSDPDAYTQYMKSKLTKSQVMKIWRAEEISSLRDNFLRFIQSTALDFCS